MSEFKCPIVQVGKIEKHPNADNLSITEVDGYPVVIRTADFKEGDRAVYIPVDAVVPTENPLFTFLAKDNLKKTVRIRAAKLRGVFSMGLLVNAEGFLLPEGSDPQYFHKLGDDLAGPWGIAKYEEPEPINTRGEDEKNPGGFIMPVYDLEPYRKYKSLFDPEEYVAISEKVHGCNGRFTFWEGQLWVGSHNRWKRRPAAGDEPSKSNVWWKAALQSDGRPVKLTPTSDPVDTLEAKLQHPEVANRYGFYGEVYGQVQDLKYGVSSGVRLAMFDILDLKTQKFLDYPEFLAVCEALGLDVCPTLFFGQLKAVDPFALAEGQSELGNGQCIREGVVIKPLRERQAHFSGDRRPSSRLILKLPGQGYLLRKGGSERH